jgi:aspartate/methionine/tyrosine aminotransferase
MFSDRTAVARHPNPLAEALDRARRASRPVLDLTVSNPTRAGFPYPEDRILAALADPRSLTYTPAPFGLDETRRAVADVYAGSGLTVETSRIVLTASTSEAYAFLFKLLCDAGDEVLVPQPSYPLFDLLARFEHVRLVPYPLAYDGQWHVDQAAARRAVTTRTRAILVVSPNNPTGSYVKRAELEALAELGLPIVADEVFAPYVLPREGETAAPRRRAPSVLEAGAGDLVFALNGLSKLAALPQMKLAWIAIGGTSPRLVNEALGRLELIADAFLSVSSPVQVAASELLAARDVTTQAVQARLVANLHRVREAVAATAVTLLDVEGGWYATLRLPGTRTEQSWTLQLLEEDGVYVHPGYFFDFAGEAYIVISLLTTADVFAEGVRRIVARVERDAGGG